MSKKAKKASIVVVVLTILAAIVVVSCTTKKGGTSGVAGIFNSPYSVDYKIVAVANSAVVEATISGPAAKLAAVLTDSEGKSRVRIIEKEEMITNSQRVLLAAPDEGKSPYILAVKTVDPEKVVWQKEIAFSVITVARNSPW